MSEFNQSQTYVNQAGVTLQAYITRVFTLMGGALAVTALVSFAGFNLVSAALASESMATVAVVIFFAAMIAQFALCFALSRRIATLQTRTATILLYGYAVVTGITFSVLPMVYDGSTLFSAFAFSAVLFFSCAVIGHTTNVDLTKFSGLLIGGLIAMVIATIASMFIPALRESLFISYIGVILFLFLTAWDMQKIKSYYYGTQGGVGQMGGNLAVYGAFQLYLDFINLFMQILRILGSRSRSKN